MSEGDFDIQEQCTNPDCYDEPSNEDDCADDCPHMIFVKVPKGSVIE
jgi:hypothetical protein